VRGADSRVGGLTVDCNNRTHEGALQSEAPLSAQRWYASGAVFMLLRKANAGTGYTGSSRDSDAVHVADFSRIEIAPESRNTSPFGDVRFAGYPEKFADSGLFFR
jgi:hypothetical protein